MSIFLAVSTSAEYSTVNDTYFSYSSLRLWDVSSGKILQTLFQENLQILFQENGQRINPENHFANSLAFSPDGSILASQTGTPYSFVRNYHPGNIEFWNISSGSLLEIFDTNVDPIRSMMFSHAGTMLAIVTYTERVRIWNIGAFSGYVDDDLDGMPNVWERTYNLNPLNFWDKFEDTDEDGLMNGMEFFLQADPTNPDSNNNGLSDLEEFGFPILMNPDRKIPIIDYVFILGFMGILIIFITFVFLNGLKRQKQKDSLSITNLLSSLRMQDFRSLYYKITIGLENVKQTWTSDYPDNDIDSLIQKETENYSLTESIFPPEIEQELKTELRGRSLLILIELAYLYPVHSHPSHVAKVLKIPHATVTFELKKLVFLQYIKPVLSKTTLQDSRYKYFSLTPKGIIFLHLLKESLSLSLTNMNVEEIMEL